MVIVPDRIPSSAATHPVKHTAKEGSRRGLPRFVAAGDQVDARRQCDLLFMQAAKIPAVQFPYDHISPPRAVSSASSP